MTGKWFKVALLNFFLAASIGAMLRFAFVEEISWMKFRYFLHAHSHVAMLGWVFSTLFILLLHAFLRPDQRKKNKYGRLFWLVQFSVAGMLISFPLQGYAGWSIFFSTLHILLSYVFAYHFWKDSRGDPTVPRRFSRSLALTAIVFMVLSTLSLWAMAPIILLDLRQSGVYYLAVQFFLHFQFNGWFLFALLALFFRFLEKHTNFHPDRNSRIFFLLLLSSTFPTYALAVTWANPAPILFFINSLGVLIQLAALIFFIGILRCWWSKIRSLLSRWTRILLQISFYSFALKVLIQTAVVIPYIATVAYTIRNFVIGFLHLMLLGMVSCFLIGLGLHLQLLTHRSPVAKTGLSVFLSGFVLSELILFVQGTMFWFAMGFLPYYYLSLFLVSALLPLGILLFLLGQLSSTPSAPVGNSL